jgi:hypothetical protein
MDALRMTTTIGGQVASLSWDDTILIAGAVT